MEIRHLKYMLAVAEEGHFNLAAKKLHLAQPALSQNIKQLEQEIGAQLFSRTTRNVELTDAGRVFYQEAINTLTQFDHAVRNARLASTGEAGTITIGFTATSIYGPLRGTIRKFRRRYPDVELILRESSATTLFDRLDDGSIDIACSEDITPNPNYEMKAYPPTDVLVAISKQHRLAKPNGPIKLRLLADESFIFPTQNTTWGVYEKFTRALAKAGIRPKRVYMADNATSGIPLVAAELGVCFVPVFTQLLHAEVTYRRIINPCIRQLPQIVRRKGKSSLPVSNFFAIA